MTFKKVFEMKLLKQTILPIHYNIQSVFSFFSHEDQHQKNQQTRRKQKRTKVEKKQTRTRKQIRREKLDKLLQDQEETESTSHQATKSEMEIDLVGDNEFLT